MAAIIPFVPSSTTPPTFLVTLDGAQYTVTVTWNLFGQRYYVTVTDQSGTRIISRPLIGSPSDYDISLVAPLFTSMLVYREATNSFEVAP